eukprot:RCo033315
MSLTSRSGHWHSGDAECQNVGNMLGDRSCVRQSRYFRQYESGNQIKTLMGQEQLVWDTKRKQGAYNGQPVYDATAPRTTSRTRPPLTAAAETAAQEASRLSASASARLPPRGVFHEPEVADSPSAEEASNGASCSQRGIGMRHVMLPVVRLPDWVPAITRGPVQSRQLQAPSCTEGSAPNACPKPLRGYQSRRGVGGLEESVGGLVQALGPSQDPSEVLSTFGLSSSEPSSARSSSRGGKRRGLGPASTSLWN